MGCLIKLNLCLSELNRSKSDLSLLLQLHIKRSNYQALIWKRSTEAYPLIPAPFFFIMDGKIAMDRSVLIGETNCFLKRFKRFWKTFLKKLMILTLCCQDEPNICSDNECLF